MRTRNALLISLAITVVAGIYGLWLAPGLPSQVPIHWDFSGKPDGWAEKGWALALGPLAMAVFGVMIVGLPWLSPKNFKIDSFRSTFNFLMVVLVGLFGYIHVLNLIAALNPNTDMSRHMVAGLMLFIGFIGNQMGKVQRNFWMGVRTPWTLASDKVWVATHRLAARLMTASGFAGAILVWFGLPTWLAFTVFIAACLYPVIYSLILYKQLEAKHAL